jgi:uncharacterized membrane protein YdbT with pleckstrin-like domain
MAEEKQYPVKASVALLVVGWIFAVLGGLIGMIIGLSIWTGKAKNPDGTKVDRYDAGSKKQGMIMFFIALAWMILGIILRAAA